MIIVYFHVVVVIFVFEFFSDLSLFNFRLVPLLTFQNYFRNTDVLHVLVLYVISETNCTAIVFENTFDVCKI